LFRRRDGEQIDVSDVHVHETTLQHRRNDVMGQAAEVRARIAVLEAECSDSALELRFDDHTTAAAELETARAELIRLDATAAALFEAQKEVNAERQKIDMAARIEEAKQAQNEAEQRARQIMADLPVVIAEAQQLARAAQAAESDYREAYRTIKGLQHHLAHFGEPQYDGPPSTGCRHRSAWNGTGTRSIRRSPTATGSSACPADRVHDSSRG
jgi:seryl-tRNA synthetase